MVREEVESLTRRMDAVAERLKVLLLPRDPLDDRNIMLEIRAGTGGEEAALWAADLVRMCAPQALEIRAAALRAVPSVAISRACAVGACVSEPPRVHLGLQPNCICSEIAGWSTRGCERVQSVFAGNTILQGCKRPLRSTVYGTRRQRQRLRRVSWGTSYAPPEHESRCRCAGIRCMRLRKAGRCPWSMRAPPRKAVTENAFCRCSEARAACRPALCRQHPGHMCSVSLHCTPCHATVQIR